MSSLVIEIQKEAIESSVPAKQLLRKVLAASSKLALSDIIAWANAELQGYQVKNYSKLPKYRQLVGDPRAYNHVRYEWQPLRTHRTQELDESFLRLTQFPLCQPIAEIESIVADSSGEVLFHYPPHTEHQMQNAMEFPTQIGLNIAKSSLVAALEEVRGICLTWALQLEQNGILGPDMAFSNDEKEQAKSAVFNINATSIGSVSNASDTAQIKNENSVSANVLTVERIEELVEQLKAATPALPKPQRDEVLLLTDQLGKEKTDQSKSRKTIQTIKDICVGTSGNLAAQGIIGAISALL